MRYYVIITDRPFWKQSRGPYTLKEAIQIKENSPYDVVITRIITEKEERKGTVANSQT